MKPILTLSIIPETKESNCYGYEKIHVYAFNIDGEGAALVSHDDSQEFDTYQGDDLHYILCGDPGDGTRWYLPKLQGSEDSAYSVTDQAGSSPIVYEA